MSIFDQLSLKTETIQLGGSAVVIREMSLAELMRYDHLKRFARDEASRFLIRTCVVEVDGKKPTDTQLDQLAEMPVRLGLPIVDRVGEFADEGQKQASAEKDAAPKKDA